MADVDEFDFRPESARISPEAFVAIGAVVLGDVVVGAGSTIWYNAVVRGDCASISIGEQTNIQDLSLLHADPGFPCQLGNRVTIGHSAIVHGAILEDEVLVGMRAVVMNGCRIGAGSLIGAGAVVTEGKQIPAGSLVLGVPGRVVRQVSAADQERILHAARHYVRAGIAARQQG